MTKTPPPIVLFFCVVGRVNSNYLNTIVKGGMSADNGPLLLDLWHNMMRRAEQGRYDDAMARLYRLSEWVAQWHLKTHCGIDTGDVPREAVPPEMAGALVAGRAGKIQIGLHDAWKLAAARCPDSRLAGLYAGPWQKLSNCLSGRNNSILAHGFAPVTAGEWKEAEALAGETLFPLLRESVAGKGGLPPQLPTEIQPFLDA